jgi:UDP-N-acetylglucosamine transferase subunit ALG13
MAAHSSDLTELTDLVFVTVGNATQGFKRLLDAVDEAAGRGIFGDEAVFIQTGNNPDFRASHCKQQAFIEPDEYESLLKNASLIISHAGAGTLIRVLRAGRIPVVMPRIPRFSEVVDNHQVELVQALASEGRVIPVYEPEDLAEAVVNCQRENRQDVPPPPSQMITLVSEAIEEILQLKN